MGIIIDSTSELLCDAGINKPATNAMSPSMSCVHVICLVRHAQQPNLKSLLHPCAYCAQTVVDLARRFTQDQRHNGLSCYVDILPKRE